LIFPRKIEEIYPEEIANLPPARKTFLAGFVFWEALESLEPPEHPLS
jgi:hypothetical protein